MKKLFFRVSPLALLALALVLSLALLGVLVGCTETEAQEEAIAEELPEIVAPVEEVEEIPTFGIANASAVTIRLENETNKVIAEIAVKLSTDEAFSGSLLPPEARIWLLKSVNLCFEPLQPADIPSETVELDVVLKPLYDVQITFAGRDVVVFHGLNLDELEEIKLCLSSDGIWYAEYLDIAGNRGSTLETERGLKEAAEAEALAAAEAARVAAEEEAAAAAAAEAAAQNQWQYNFNSGGGGGSGGQVQDQCVGDLVFN